MIHPAYRFLSRRRSLIAASFGLFASGCIIIPAGDLLKGPSLEEVVVRQGAGFFRKEKIALIDISGVLVLGDEGLPVPSEPSTVADVKAQLDRAARDPEVEAVVLRISSPGGEVTASDILYEEVRRLEEKEKLPVVACIMEEGASGGYYVACGARRIIAHPTSVVGSIGVIVHNYDLSGLLAKLGMAVHPVKSSEMKDILSIYRPPTEKERQVIERMVTDLYQRFVDVVDESRSELSREEVVELADGRIVSGADAAALKLVDRTGYLSDAIEEAAQAAGIESPTVVRYTRKSPSGANIYTSRLSSADAVSSGASSGGVELTLRWQPVALSASRFYYLRQP